MRYMVYILHMMYMIYIIYMIYIKYDIHIPVVPHKAVAEVSKQETYRRGWLL